MSSSSESINVTFKNGDVGYEPTFDGKFVDHLYQLMLNRNVKEVKKMISEIRSDQQQNEIEHSEFVMDYVYAESDDYGEFEEDMNDISLDSRIADIVFPNGFKPLILAAQLALPELVGYFVSLGFDVNCKNSKSSMTPLLAACSSACTTDNPKAHAHNIKECILLLIESGASLTCSVLHNNEFALHLLASNNYIEPCEYLLPFIDNVDCRNDRRCTPLMLAASKGHIDMVKLLLDYKADKTLRNINGLSPVELARANNHEDVVGLLMTATDKLDFYRAWSVAHNEIVTENSNHNIKQSFLKNFNARYQDDPLAYMCINLNLPHLQPIFDREGVTFSQLLCMSDTDLKKIGVVRFADRKSLLNTVQEIHKYPWNHEASIYAPDYKKSVKPNELIDMIVTINNHFEMMESTLKYICHHLTVNSSNYADEPRIKSFLDKISNHCEMNIFETNNIHGNIAKMNSFFDKMYEHALDEDVTSQLNDEKERIRQQRSLRKYSGLVKAGVVISGVSLVLVVLWRSTKRV